MDSSPHRRGWTRTQATRKLKVARVLGEAQWAEEARAAVQEAATWMGRALAVQYHFPEPMNLNAAFTPPLSLAWAESLARMRSFGAIPWERSYR